jgi:hypothetical protein
MGSLNFYNLLQWLRPSIAAKSGSGQPYLLL